MYVCICIFIYIYMYIYYIYMYVYIYIYVCSCTLRGNQKWFAGTSPIYFDDFRSQDRSLVLAAVAEEGIALQRLGNEKNGEW